MTFAEIEGYRDVLIRSDLGQPEYQGSGQNHPSRPVKPHSQSTRDRDASKSVPESVVGLEGNRVVKGVDDRVGSHSSPFKGHALASRPEKYLSERTRRGIRSVIALTGAVWFGFMVGQVVMADVPITVPMPHFTIGQN